MRWSRTEGGPPKAENQARRCAGCLLLSALWVACAQPSTQSVTIPVTVISATARATAPPLPAATQSIPPTPRPTNTRVVESATPSATADPVVGLMAVGDVMLARSVGDLILAQGPAAPWAAVADVFSQADLLTGNLECAITAQGEPAAKAYTFAAPLEAAPSLALAGFDVLALANNHSLDYGPGALADMQAALTALGIQSVGAGPNSTAARAPVFVTRLGLRLAFLAYVDVPVETRTQFDTRGWTATGSGAGVVWAIPQDIAVDVAAAKARSDVVVVWLHMGYEGRTEVTAAQRTAAHAAVDAGAALVLGAHPHVLQPIEHYGAGLIVYSLGNFIFDGFGLPENYSAVFSATLTREGVRDFGWTPVVIANGLPRLASPDEAARILALLQPR